MVVHHVQMDHVGHRDDLVDFGAQPGQIGVQHTRGNEDSGAHPHRLAPGSAPLG